MIDNQINCVTYPLGFKAAAVRAGIKKSGKLDLALIYSEVPAAVAGTFTKNKVAAAPVHVSKKVVAGGTAQAILANSGIANACTGVQGMKDAEKSTELVAQALNINSKEVIVASTGLIGHLLPMDKMATGVKEVAPQLSPSGGHAAAEAIITTDTHPKYLTSTITVDNTEVKIGAIAKGSGMIRPDMATMLCFITTDLNIDSQLLQKALSSIVEKSFNMISVDGDMSTNDMVIVMANGYANNPKITTENEAYHAFVAELEALCTKLSKEIAADGEGATKLLNINVKGAASFADAKLVGMAIANSPLVKTAFFGEDPNWGRVICAAGYSGAAMDPDKTVLKIGGIPLYAEGIGVDYDHKSLMEIMAKSSIDIDVELDQGQAEATVWSCDFSYDYVKINGEYHT